KDTDGTIQGFVVKGVPTGTLMIGGTPETATPWMVGVNDTVDVTHSAYWMGSPNVHGTFQALSVVARDDMGGVSQTPVMVSLEVTPVNDVPVLTSFNGSVVTVAEDTRATITFSDLLLHGDATDADGTIQGFVVKGVPTGQLLIGATLESAMPWMSGSNDTIDMTQNAYWTAAPGAHGLFNALNVVARDNNGAVSPTPVSVSLEVTSVNDAPNLTGFTGSVATIPEDTQATITFSDLLLHGDAMDADGTIQGFVIKGVPTGQLLIGTSPGTATPWMMGSNDTVDATHNAYWTGAPDAHGIFTALSVVAQDNNGTLSPTPVSVTLEVTPVNDIPVGSLTIVGEAIQNSMLSVINTLVDPDETGPMNFSYQWQADGSTIVGVTGDHLLLTENEVGKKITVTAFYSDGFGQTGQVSSAATDMVVNVNDAPMGSVIIQGSIAEGQTLTAINTLTDADGMGTVSYQWMAGGVAIEGATGNTLLLTDLQFGQPISVVASYVDGHGTTESVSSTSTEPVTPPTQLVFTITGNEDTPISFSPIQTQLSSLAGSVSGDVYVMISGVPTGATLSAGTSNGYGTWTLTPQQILSGLTITPPSNNAADFDLNVVVMPSGSGMYYGSPLGYGTVHVVVNAVADTPVILPSLETSLTFQGFETGIGTTSTLGNVQVVGSTGYATPTQGTQQVQLSNMGVSRSEIETFLGLASGGLTANDGTVTNGSAIKMNMALTAGGAVHLDWLFKTNDYLPYNDFAFVSIWVPGDATATFQRLSDVSQIGNYGNSGYHTFDYMAPTSGMYTIGLGVVNVRDTSVDSVAYVDNIRNAGGEVATSSIPLSFTASSSDTDGSESSTFTLSGVPAAVTLSQGTDQGNGTWLLTAAQMSGLTLTPPQDAKDNFFLTVTATRTEAENGSTASATDTIWVDVTGTEGTLEPGGVGNAGRLTVAHYGTSLVLDPTAVLHLELGGTVSNTQYDHLVIPGKVVWGGTVAVSLINGFTPTVGDQFQVVSSGQSLGGADHVQGVDLGNGMMLEPLFTEFGLNLVARSVTYQGTSGDDVYAGGGDKDIVMAGGGNDTLTAWGSDMLFGGDGNDVFTMSDTSFSMIDGGAGIDTLKVGLSFFDMSAVSGYRLSGIDIIDMEAGSGTHVMKLSPALVGHLPDAGGVLRVWGDASDTLAIGTGWGTPATINDADGHTYNEYTQGSMTLLVDSTIQVATTDNFLPTLTGFSSAVTTVNEDMQATITLSGLLNHSDAADLDGPVTGFVVKSVASGQLMIGGSAGTATAWVAGVNDTVDATHNAYWTGDLNANGSLSAFTAVALDNQGGQSATPQLATVDVMSVNDAPALTNFSAPVGTIGDGAEATITLQDMLSYSNAMDMDGTVTGFVVTAVDQGTLKIGTSAQDAYYWSPYYNNVVDATHNAYWTAPTNVLGSNIGALQVVAMDDLGATSSNPVSVAMKVEHNVAVSSLVATAGFVVDGALAGDHIGFAVSAAGDFNHDGIDDFLIGAPGVGANGSQIGAAYVIYGNTMGFPSHLDLAMQSNNDRFQLDGISNGDHAGSSVSSAGDFNGDGYDDVVIGSPHSTGIDYLNSGETSVVFGSGALQSSALSLSNLGAGTGFRMAGVNTGDNSGSSVSSAGDVNGDGIDDLLVGAPYATGSVANSGVAYVVYGSQTGYASLTQQNMPISLGSLGASTGLRISGMTTDQMLGFSVSRAGDFNGDGIGDLIVGAPHTSVNAPGNGAAYVVFGQGAGFGAATNLDVSALVGSNGFKLSSNVAGDGFGGSVQSAGDINGDGFDDLIMGADGVGPNATGKSYVVFGTGVTSAALLDVSTLAGGNGFAIKGAAANDQSGISVSSAGDMNGDGYADLIVGTNSGTATVLFGKASGFNAEVDLANLDPAAGFQITGSVGHVAVSGAGDVNHDGLDDVIVGARDTGVDGTMFGSSTVVFGNHWNTASAVAQTMGGSAGAEILRGGASDDVLEGNGGADVLIGGAGNDILAIADATFQRVDGGGGMDVLRLDGNLNLTLTPTLAGRIHNIEVIDLQYGDIGHALALTATEIKQMIGSGHQLRILGDGMDTVHLSGLGWNLLQSGPVTIDGHNYDVYQNGGLSVQLDTTISHVVDPVVLDLNGDGIGVTDRDHGVSFDMNLTGKPQATGWVNPSDAFLSLDTNHDGVINDASELFSERMFQDVHSGMGALAKFDANQDHLINANDAVFKDLLLWQDANHNGISEADELSTLAGKGIGSIQLDTTTDGHWQGSNRVLTNGHFTYTDGHDGQLSEVALQSGGRDGATHTGDAFGQLLQGHEATYTDLFSSHGVGESGQPGQGIYPVAKSNTGQQASEGLFHGNQLGGGVGASPEVVAGGPSLHQALASFLHPDSSSVSGPDAWGRYDTQGQGVVSLASLMKSGTHGDHMAFLDPGVDATQDHSQVEHDTIGSVPTHWLDGAPPVDDVLHHPVHALGG
ncbi:MAG: FG-GAP repeat protein, partial [Magnetococcales bacterium]|nr:FG-GAP repeat protein [Magnetococcales bacterium]